MKRLALTIVIPMLALPAVGLAASFAYGEHGASQPHRAARHHRVVRHHPRHPHRKQSRSTLHAPVGHAASARSSFSLVVTPTTVSATAGAGASLTVRTNGSSQTLSLSATGLPAGVRASFDPSRVRAGGTSELSLTAASSASAGNSKFAVLGAGQTGTESVQVPLSVKAAARQTTTTASTTTASATT